MVRLILNKSLGEQTREIGVFGLAGDSTAATTHEYHKKNPSIDTNSVCILDGDSSLSEDLAGGILKLPGGQPENYIYSFAMDNLHEGAAILAAYCQYDPTKQENFKAAVKKIRATTDDPHLFYSKLGIELGFISEDVVKRAFITYWCDKSVGELDRIRDFVAPHLTGSS